MWQTEKTFNKMGIIFLNDSCRNLVGNQHGYLLKTGSVSSLVSQKQSSVGTWVIPHMSCSVRAFRSRRMRMAGCGPGRKEQECGFRWSLTFRLRERTSRTFWQRSLRGQGQASRESCRCMQQLLNRSRGEGRDIGLPTGKREPRGFGWHATTSIYHEDITNYSIKIWNPPNRLTSGGKIRRAVCPSMILSSYFLSSF